jgi:hypothetical protein
VDNLKISHVDDNVVGGILELIKEEFGKDLDVTFTHGKVHDYLACKSISVKRKGYHADVQLH